MKIHSHVSHMLAVLFALSVGAGGVYLVGEYGNIGMASIMQIMQSRRVTVDSFIEAIREDNTKYPDTIVIGWVGDIAPHAQHTTPSLDLFTPLKSLYEIPHIMTGNLEGAITESGFTQHEKCKPGTKNNGCWQFIGDSLFLEHLERVGFDVLNLANNHIKDAGVDGIGETSNWVRSYSMIPAGIEDTITYTTVNGATIAFIGVSPFDNTTDIDDIDRVASLVREADIYADSIVVFFHAGGEGVDKTIVRDQVEYWNGWRRGNSYRMAHVAIDAGADLVLGSGPHTLRGVELYRDRLIAYSLANFANNGAFNREGDLSLSGILFVRIDPKTGAFVSQDMASVILVPPGIPTLDPSQTALQRVMTYTARDFPDSFSRLFEE